MKLNKLTIENFLRIGQVALDLKHSNIHLICGLNEAGKSSIQEALRFGLLGESDRVQRKGDYALMVKDGAASGEVLVSYSEGEGGDEQFIMRDVATGKVTGGSHAEVDPALAYVMDATRYPFEDAKKQRQFLFKHLQIRITSDEVCKRLLAKDVPEKFVEMIKPLLRHGFDAAMTEVKNYQSKARGAWQATTGEKYGSVKALTWKPPEFPVIQDMVDAAERSLNVKMEAHQLAIAKHDDLKAYVDGFSMPCPHCQERLSILDHTIVKASDQPTPEQIEAKAEAHNAMRMASVEVGNARTKFETLKDQMQVKSDAVKLAASALEMHREIAQWTTIEELLSPGGIPAEMISESLEPINKRLHHSASITHWEPVTITPSMEVLIGTRPYTLQSESSQWRAQAQIAEAVSFTGHKLLVLDRFDVLDIGNRAKLLMWLDNVSQDHDTILLFATLKQRPKLPPSFNVHWLEDGKVVLV